MTADDPVLTARLAGINEAQKRTSLALFVCTLAAGTVLGGIWNAYFSWDRQWANSAKPELWGQEQLLESQIEAWMESNTVGISLLGIRLAVSDVAVTGTIVLLVLAYYHYLCARRENHELGELLIDLAAGTDVAVRRLALVRIRSHMIATSAGGDDRIYTSLTDRNTPHASRLPWRRVTGVLTYLPAVTVAIIVASDVYFSFFFVSPWRGNEGAAWFSLLPSYQVQLVLMDVFAVAVGAIVIWCCKETAACRSGIQRLIEQFSHLVASPVQRDVGESN